MAIKVIAQRRELKIGKNPGVKKFVMRPDLYIPIQEKKVFAEASTHSGISAGVIKAAWDAAGEVIRTWATEGHSIPLPGLGTMRFGVRSKAVEKLEDVKLAWSDKTKAEIAAAKGDSSTGSGSSTGSETAGGGSSTGSETAGGDPQNPGDGDGLDQD